MLKNPKWHEGRSFSSYRPVPGTGILKGLMKKGSAEGLQPALRVEGFRCLQPSANVVQTLVAV